MPTADHIDFVLVPVAGDPALICYYELTAVPAYCPNSFVLIPYENPRLNQPKAKFYRIEKEIEMGLPAITQATSKIRLQARTSKEKYIQKLNKLKEHIQRGNIYEINYCIEFFAENVSIEPLHVFTRLHQLAKAPYSMLAKLGDTFIICASPELFLKKEGDLISSKPIKGTTRRGQNAREDGELRNALFNSHKERTENVMAVDVARNDLSRFAKKGSVSVNKLYNIETFETVHQMVSTVSCEVKEGVSFGGMIEATFPMASMTGAPKISAMNLIDEYEDFKRGNYSGAMGLIDAKGDFSLAVIIRSIFYDQRTKHLSIAVGGAITYLSDPQKEYQECLLKAGALLKALNAEMV